MINKDGYNKCIVAFLDILGFNIWMRKKLDKYVAELELSDTGTCNVDKLL